jgi:uncharacterized 2Fe-2S/4Fe-4S cluster protein (DUF4445 family)
MDYKIKIHCQAQTHEYLATKGFNLLQFLKQKNYEMHTPCNGLGICGKCRVKLSNCIIPEPSLEARKILGDPAIAEGYRLACQTAISTDMEVHLDNCDFQAKILTEGKQKNFRLALAVVKKLATIPAPSLDDQCSDSERLADFLSLKKESDSLNLIRQMPKTLRQNNFQVTLIFNNNKLIGLEAGDTTAKLYGIAVDIGTTTIAAYLLDLLTGEKIATYSCLNPQRKFGADVISRIKQTMETPNGLEEMHGTIIDGLNQAARYLTQSAGLKSSDVYEMVCVGNTTMMHFLLKIPAENIAVSPFIPAATHTLTINAADIGLQINKNAILTAVPSVAAYIGADTVAAVSVSAMNRKKNISLLIDLGTNGEIVLGNNKWLLACSAAAGPAFEGANIRYGVGGVKGAIDSFNIGKNPMYTTIGEAQPVGICGSGLIDIISELYKAGIINGTGRLQTDPAEVSGPFSDLLKRITEIDGMASFIVADGNVAAGRQDILITQKDIRELQSAKSAIAAGIKVLVKRAGIGLGDIEKVYLAGGFGAYINIESALNIGLIPSELQGRIESLGNAAGTGAIAMLCSRHVLKKAEQIKKEIQYVELSACKEFNDFFIDSMIFGED